MIFRTLLANFVVMVLPVLLIAGGVILLSKSRATTNGTKAKLYVGALLISLPTGVIAYIASGIIAAAVRGEGHFYSLPFGGYTVSDNVAIGTSIFVWIGLVFVCVVAIFRPRSKIQS